MKKRWLLRLILFVALVASFALSASGAQAGGETAPPIELSIWVFGGPLFSSEMAVLDAYTAAHPNVTFTIYQPTDLFAELAAAIPAGTGPDILYQPNNALPELALDHYLVRLEKYGVNYAYLKANFGTAAADAAMFGDGVYAVPHLLEGVALVYNRDIVPAQYLPADPMDFAGLAASAARYLEDTGTPLICNQGFGTLDAYHVAPIFFGYGIPDYITPDGRVYANDPRAIQAAEWIQDIHSVLYDAQDYGTCQWMLINGYVGMWWTGPWAIAELTNQGVNFGILPMGVPYIGIKQQMVTVNALSRGYADEAVDFLMFFDNTANSITYATQTGLIPANRAALHDPAVQALPSVQGFSQSIALGTPMGTSVFTSCQWAPLAVAVNTLWNDPAANAQDALDGAQAEIEACVEQMRAETFPQCAGQAGCHPNEGVNP